MRDRDGVPGPVALDATPLVGPVTGIGRYVSALVQELAGDPRTSDLGLVTVSVRRGFGDAVPAPGTWHRALRLPAPLWRRTLPRGSRAVDLALRPARLWHMTNFVAPRPRGLPYTVAVHDLAYLRLPEHVNPGAALLRHLMPQVLRGAAGVVAVSATTRDDLLDAYPWLDAPVVVAPLGVDQRWSRSTPAGGRGPVHRATPTAGDEGYVLAVGTREPRKNLGLLVRAHALARRADPTTPRLVIVGRHGWGPDLDGERPRASDVQLVEDADDRALEGWLQGARALLAPSHREGFGLPVLEAMAAGVPVVASDIGAHRELLRGSGVLLDPRDLDGWAHAIARPPDGGVARVAAAARRAGEHTWERTAQRHVALWRDVLDGPRRDRHG